MTLLRYGHGVLNIAIYVISDVGEKKWQNKDRLHVFFFFFFFFFLQ